jgi:hypothetical protein
MAHSKKVALQRAGAPDRRYLARREVFQNIPVHTIGWYKKNIYLFVLVIGVHFGHSRISNERTIKIQMAKRPCSFQQQSYFNNSSTVMQAIETIGLPSGHSLKSTI